MSGPPRTRGDVVELRGTARADRERPELGQDDPDYAPRPPEWLTELAAEIWHQRVAEYRRRGQRIQGFEPMLAHYVSLEADIIDKRQRPGAGQVTASMLTQLLRFAAAFYDTPGATMGGGGASSTDGPDNPFAKRGKPRK